MAVNLVATVTARSFDQQTYDLRLTLDLRNAADQSTVIATKQFYFPAFADFPDVRQVIKSWMADEYKRQQWAANVATKIGVNDQVAVQV